MYASACSSTCCTRLLTSSSSCWEYDSSLYRLLRPVIAFSYVSHLAALTRNVLRAGPSKSIHNPCSITLSSIVSIPLRSFTNLTNCSTFEFFSPENFIFQSLNSLVISPDLRSRAGAGLSFLSKGWYGGNVSDELLNP